MNFFFRSSWLSAEQWYLNVEVHFSERKRVILLAEKGEYGGGYSEKDAAKDTGVSTKEAVGAWHQARDDAEGEPGWAVPKDRHNKDNDSSSDSGK